MEKTLEAFGLTFERFGLHGIWRVVHRDAKGRYLGDAEWHNVVATEGYTSMLNVYFHGATQITTWYFAPWTTSNTPAASNTYASPNQTETTAYTSSTRLEWTEDAASSGSITNSTAVTLTANASVTITGFGLVSNNTKNDQAAAGAVLFSSGLLSSAKTLAANETLDITYTCSS